jgi:hypothetical protein
MYAILQPCINSKIYPLQFSWVKILVDSGVHSEHVQVIRCNILPSLVKISSLGEHSAEFSGLGNFINIWAQSLPKNRNHNLEGGECKFAFQKLNNICKK